MKKLALGALALVLVGSSCMGAGGGGGDSRTVLVDFSHDEFASFIIANFPEQISVHPGTELVFRQTWTGEPHTVTGGTLVNEMMEKAAPFSALFSAFEELQGSGAELPEEGEEPDLPVPEFFERVDAAENEDAARRLVQAYDDLRDNGVPLPARDDDEATMGELDRVISEESEAIFENAAVPWAFDETEDGDGYVTQNAGQPCYLTRGAPPKDPDRACRDAQQEQPEFDGTHSYYNSGVIPYEGPGGNTYRVQLADDIDTGDYSFYCAVHGPDQATVVKVVSADTEIPSQEEVSRQAREEISRFDEPMEKAFKDAEDGEIDMNGETLEGPFAGLSPPIHGSINEFVPKELSVKVGEEVKWKMLGSDHTISFDVPEYFPIIQFADDGKVSLNPRLQPPAGGAPTPEEQEGEGLVKIDGGTYDGRGFWSSGLLGAQPYLEYTLRFARPGTYKYACLLHPPMVGSVVVTR